VVVACGAIRDKINLEISRKPPKRYNPNLSEKSQVLFDNFGYKLFLWGFSAGFIMKHALKP
jgi:hypothetical protein